MSIHVQRATGRPRPAAPRRAGDHAERDLAPTEPGADGPRGLGSVTNEVALGLAGVERLGVAFSGGVDSSLLLALAVRVLGADHVVAVLGVSPSLAADERTGAHDVAAVIGVPVVEVATHEGDNPAYQANGPDRCFHCKDELFTRISDEVAAAHRLTAVAYGENADDASRPDRPGAQAATNHAVLRPLAEAGLTKADVRRLARELGLPNADKPAAPCLASRIPHFSEVDPAKLAQIESAEHALRRLGFGDSRVRHHGDVARVELPPADLARAVAPEVRKAVLAAVRAAGFTFVALDLAGIQSGAFTLPLVQVNRV
jgi:pyridinium-3,5-biscarboxylic acid mononucleotide sulfurtransferase